MFLYVFIPSCAHRSLTISLVVDGYFVCAKQLQKKKIITYLFLALYEFEGVNKLFELMPFQNSVFFYL
jgi:hypothetical protein